MEVETESETGTATQTEEFDYLFHTLAVKQPCDEALILPMTMTRFGFTLDCLPMMCYKECKQMFRHFSLGSLQLYFKNLFPR